MTSAVRALLTEARGGASARRDATINLIGLDVANQPSRLRRHQFAPALIAALVCALFLVALRVDLIRMRYAMAQTLAQEQELFESQRTLTVKMRQQRDPARIAQQARELGFIRPERIIDLPADTGSAAQLANAPARGAEAQRRP